MVKEFVGYLREGNGGNIQLCALDKFMYGAMLKNEMPKADFIVTGSAPCDSSRIGYQMFEHLADCAIYRLDAPLEDSPEAHQYYAGEIRKLIGFLEENDDVRAAVQGDRLGPPAPPPQPALPASSRRPATR